MIFHGVQTEGLKKEFGEMEKVMKNLGFVRWSWDYHKATYDFRYTLDGIDYYLRLSGTVVNHRQLEHPKAVLVLSAPIFARHFFPHGLDESAPVPEGLEAQVRQKLKELEKALQS